MASWATWETHGKRAIAAQNIQGRKHLSEDWIEVVWNRERVECHLQQFSRKNRTGFRNCAHTKSAALPG